ncbi:MAG: glycoside hydrolase family 16 protein [Planctomycetota bacterium]|nr:glycoside hydrolase family 16 protein [Planctomycetota bacterium]
MYLSTHKWLSLVAAASVVLAAMVAGGAPKPGKGGGKGGGNNDGPRSISFAGYNWTVKSSNNTVGPGPNYFSNSENNVWVDELGRLHMKITRQGKKWYAAEVICQESFGHGAYDFYLDSRVDDLDPNVVLGLFTWHDDPAFAHREIDIEFARWGNATDPTNAQYVVQPWDAADHLVRFTQPNVAQSTHSFNWLPNSVWFQSLVGHRVTPEVPEDVISSTAYNGSDIPQPGGENARINLWLMQGKAPTDRTEIEVIIADFKFTPEL